MFRQAQHGRGQERRGRLYYLALLLTFWAFFAWRIHASIAAGIADNAVLGADAAEILRAIDRGDYHGLSVIKHPLVVIWAAVTIAPLRLVGMDAAMATSLSFGFAGALVPLGTAMLARLWHAGWLAALAVAALATTGFATLTVLSIVESYAVTLAMIPATLIGLTLIARHLPDGWFAGVCAGLAAAIAAWANLPLAALVLAYPALRATQGRGKTGLRDTALVPLLVAGAGAIAPTILLALLIGFDRQQSTISQWTSFSHFTDPAILSDYLASALAFGTVSPDLAMQCRYPAAALVTLWADPLRLVVLAGLWLLIAAGTISGLRRSDTRFITLALVGIVAVWLLFFLWFAPVAALLFAGQWWVLLPLLCLPLLSKSRTLSAVALGLAIVMGTLNAAPLQDSPISDFAASCPAELQVNGGI